MIVDLCYYLLYNENICSQLILQQNKVGLLQYSLYRY